MIHTHFHKKLIWQTVRTVEFARSVSKVPSSPVQFNKFPVTIATNDVLGILIRDKVTANSAYSCREVSQHILVNALARFPVDLGEIVIFGRNNRMLAGFGGVKVS